MIVDLLRVDRHLARAAPRSRCPRIEQVISIFLPDTSITILWSPSLPTISIRSAPLVSSNLISVAGARSEEAPVVVRRLAVVGRRRIVLAPQRAEDVRPPRVAVLEGDEHLVVPLGPEEQPAALAAHRRGDAAPSRSARRRGAGSAPARGPSCSGSSRSSTMPMTMPFSRCTSVRSSRAALELGRVAAVADRVGRGRRRSSGR